MDLLAEEYTGLSGYAFSGNNPLILVDRNGGFFTHYVDKDYNVLFQTDDGSDDVVMVPDAYVGDFRKYSDFSSGLDYIFNSLGWNRYWKEQFGLAERQLTEVEIEVSNWYKSDKGKNNAIKFFLSHKESYMQKAAWSEARYHLSSIESWADGLSMTFWVKGLFKNFGQKMVKTQIHHFATNKHSYYTIEMDRIAKQFGLSLDGEWNKAKMPHSGRHTHHYHEFVLENMIKASQEAGGSQAKFLHLFDKYVKQPVLRNPKLLQQKK